MTAETLLALAKRCEQEEPSERLDFDILDAITPVATPWAYKPFTKSLDAAVGLVPPDAWKEICGPRKYLNIPSPAPNYWHCELMFGAAPPYKRADAWAATEVLALCAAALRARAATFAKE